METTLTLNDGTANVLFTWKRTEDGAVLWTSPSPQGDFDGIRRHERKAVKTKGNILQRTSITTIPLYDAETGKYTFAQARTVLSAPTASALVEAEKALNLSKSAFDTTANPTYKGEFVGGIEAYE